MLTREDMFIASVSFSLRIETEEKKKSKHLVVPQYSKSGSQYKVGIIWHNLKTSIHLSSKTEKKTWIETETSFTSQKLPLFQSTGRTPTAPVIWKAQEYPTIHSYISLRKHNTTTEIQETIFVSICIISNNYECSLGKFKKVLCSIGLKICDEKASIK